MSKLLFPSIVTVLSIGLTGCGKSASPVAPSVNSTASLASDSSDATQESATALKPGDQTIVEIVLANDGEFDVLQAAVVRAGLVDTLNGKGQYTVFAPTDAAFATTLGVADEAAALAVIGAMPLDQLKNILLYHVTNGRRSSKSVLAAPQYQMLNGGTLTREKLMAAGIAKTDISASNGIIHVINHVLLP